MSWSASTGWWIAAGVLVAFELASGTFYLLLMALGAVAAAIAAHLGLGITGQLTSAALVGGGFVAAWHVKRSRAPAALPANADKDVNMDIGGRVHVKHWDADGTGRVDYRGANWRVRHAGTGTPAPGAFVITAIDGNELQLTSAAH